MKTNKIILILIGLILSFNIFSQETLLDDFDRFKSFFNYNKNDESINHLNYIPLDLSLKLLGDEIINEYVISVGAWGIFEKEKNTIFIIESMYPAGGYSSSYHIISFSNDGKMKKDLGIGYNMLDGDGGILSEITIINDTLLEVKEEDLKFNSDGDKIVLKTKYSYFIINKKGFFSIKIPAPESERLYPQVSSRIISESELTGMSKSELDIMRNEVFAEYGYIFRTKKWKEYFEKQDWYNPSYDDVTDKLTIIEKINTKKILEIAPLRPEK